ncbi:MAG: Na(+)/H(+) antiporter subunit D [Planctomycetota bacterium]
MILGALLLPLLGRAWAARGGLVLTVLSLFHFLSFDWDASSDLVLLGQSLQWIRIDSLSWPFLLVFHIAAIVAAIYALHVDDVKQHVAAVTYAGAAIAAAATGDLISLFVCWELTAITSVFLVWARRGEAAYRSGLRYLIIQVASGVLLLSGAILQYNDSGSLAFGSFLSGGSPTRGGWLVLASFGIKAAFPLLHNWLQDAYPKATVTGTVFLSAFTTKLAIYALARGFRGFEALIEIGCVMTLFPIVFAVIENDLRKVLAYSLNNQLGFMVVGIGIGTELAINGTVAHAFCHILYKSLLFMSMGAVLYRVGTTQATRLGGLHRSMPWTTTFCIIGAGAISGFPLLSGFVSKSMIITAAAEEHYFWPWVILLIASAGVMEHSGIKIPFFAFFSHDAGHRVQEAPRNMLVAMGIAAFFCVILGVYYPMLYKLLPNKDFDYHPFTSPHVINQLQLLMFATLAFVVLKKTGLYPAEKESINVDSDIVYRRWLPKFNRGVGHLVAVGDKAMRQDALLILNDFAVALSRRFAGDGLLGRTWSSSTMTAWATVLLAACLALYYLA